MNNHRLDEFFKKKLGNAEIQPGITANEKFLTQLERKRAGYNWWKVAASVTILGIVTWVFFSQDEVSNIEKIANSSESNMTSTSPEIPGEVVDVLPQIAEASSEENTQETESMIVEESKIEPEIAMPPLLAVNDTLVKKEKMTENLIAEQIIEDNVVIPTHEELPDLSNETLIASNKPIVKERKLPSVRITYISGKKKRQEHLAESIASTDTSRISPLNRIFNGAVSLADGTLIAELRDAKEDFFNRNND